MRKFNKGDIVICVKYSVEQKFEMDNTGIRTTPYINDKYFNRRAYISGVYTNCEDMDEYQITFLDNGSTLAWVKGKNWFY